MIRRRCDADMAGIVDRVLAGLSLEAKIGQMTQASVGSCTLDKLKELQLGSVLNEAVSSGPYTDDPAEWRDLVGRLQQQVKIPLLYGIDAVHGHAGFQGATVFPHNIGLGAANQADLVRRIGVATAREMLETGAHWNFAPAVSVARDVRWGRTYESYSEQPGVVAPLAAAYIDGLQSSGVVATAKHFVADGGTRWGTTDGVDEGTLRASFQVDQGDAQITEAELRQIHLPPYVEAVRRGVDAVMVSYSRLNGVKMHKHRALVQGVLKDELGFQGIVVSDYWGVFMHHEGTEYQQVINSVNAGIDMAMVGSRFQTFIHLLTRAVQEGQVSMSRIDDAVRRILRVKHKYGLLEADPGRPKSWVARIHQLVPSGTRNAPSPPSALRCAEHLALAREAAIASAVLLKNAGRALPLSSSASSEPVLVLGQAAASLALQCGGWTMFHQGASRADYQPHGETLMEGLEAELGASRIVFADSPEGLPAAAPTAYGSCVVVVAETMYAEGHGDNEHPSLTADDHALIREARKRSNRVVLVIYSGRPIDLGGAEDTVDAVVAAWLPGSMASALASLLVGRSSFVGRLSFAWPRTMRLYRGFDDSDAAKSNTLYAFGHGLSC